MSAPLFLVDALPTGDALILDGDLDTLHADELTGRNDMATLGASEHNDTLTLHGDMGGVHDAVTLEGGQAHSDAASIIGGAHGDAS